MNANPINNRTIWNAAPKKGYTRVKITRPGGLLHPHEQRLALPNDIFDLPTDKASALIREGRATGYATVRAKRDNVFAGSRTCMKGEETIVEQGRAETLAERNLVTIVQAAPTPR